MSMLCGKKLRQCMVYKLNPQTAVILNVTLRNVVPLLYRPYF